MPRERFSPATHSSSTSTPLIKKLVALRDRAPFRMRVTISLLFCLAPAVTVIGYSSVTLSSILADSELEAHTDDLAKDAALASTDALQCRRYEKDLLLNCRDIAAQDRYLEQWREQFRIISEQLTKMWEATAAGAELSDAQTHTTLDAMIARLPAYHDTVERVVAESRAAASQDPVAMNDALGPSKDSIRDVITVCQEINQHFTELAEPAEQEVHAGLGRLATTLFVGTIATVVTGVASALLVPTVLTRRIRTLGRFVGQVRAGDKSARNTVGGEDEIGRLAAALNGMLDELDASAERERAAAVAEASAREAGEIKMRFLANMSHEIRTPMTAILGFTDLLLDPTLSAQSRTAHTETIRRNGNHLLGLINDVLDLSKIQAEKMALTIDRAQVCRLVAEAAAMVRVRAAEKGLPLNVVYEFPIPEHIKTDALRLRQVLVNLLGNAVKFTEHGSVKLVARADGLSDPVPFITFVISDTGVGMSPEQLSGLFQPFSQVDDSATRRFGGTGLGLCISKELIDRLGGSLRVVSEVGKGTEFTLRLPVGDIRNVRLVHNAEEALAEAAAPEPAVSSIRLNGRVLLAEDGVDNQRLISLVLTKAGAEVEVVENGKLALDATIRARDQGRPFDLVLMDMQMPVLDGYSATCELRERGYEGPIVALTAHAMPTDRQRCLLAGCDEYTTKPIDRAVFIPLVQRFLVNGRAAQTA